MSEFKRVNGDYTIQTVSSTSSLGNVAINTNNATVSGNLTISNGVVTSSNLQITTGNVSPTITSGFGVPTSIQPSGSLYLRGDGGIGSHLYVSNGSGTWAAVSGV